MRTLTSRRASFPIVVAEDVSAVIPVKIDSAQRRRNLEHVVEYLRKMARGIEILVVEQESTTALNKDQLASNEVDHVHVPGDGSHWKTRNANLGAKLARRNILLFLDCDVVLDPGALKCAIEMVRENGGFAQPFNGVLVEFNRGLVEKCSDICALLENASFFAPDYDKNLPDLDFSAAIPLYGGSDYLATGGAVVCDRRDFFLIGGYNENFISYGFEDMEFFERIVKFGYTIKRIHTANAYHLPHPRGEDSSYGNFYRSNECEYHRVRDMSPEKLRHYVYNGFREVQFESGLTPRITQGKHHYHLDLLPDERKTMGGLEIVFLVLERGPDNSDARLEQVFHFLEGHCTQYRIVLFERGSRSLRHPLTMKNYFYTWLDPKLFSEQQSRDLVRGRPQPRYCLEIVDLNYDPTPLLRRLQQLPRSGLAIDPQKRQVP